MSIRRCDWDIDDITVNAQTFFHAAQHVVIESDTAGTGSNFFSDMVGELTRSMCYALGAELVLKAFILLNHPRSELKAAMKNKKRRTHDLLKLYCQLSKQQRDFIEGHPALKSLRVETLLGENRNLFVGTRYPYEYEIIDLDPEFVELANCIGDVFDTYRNHFTDVYDQPSS